MNPLELITPTLPTAESFTAEIERLTGIGRTVHDVAERSNISLQGLQNNQGLAQQTQNGWWAGTPEEPGLYQQLQDLDIIARLGATALQVFDAISTAIRAWDAAQWVAFGALAISGVAGAAGIAVAFARHQINRIVLKEAVEQFAKNFKHLIDELNALINGRSLKTSNGLSVGGLFTKRGGFQLNMAGRRGRPQPEEPDEATKEALEKIRRGRTPNDRNNKVEGHGHNRPKAHGTEQDKTGDGTSQS